MRMTLGEACHFYSGTGFPEVFQGVADGEFPFFKVGDISANVSEGNTYLERCSNYISADVVTAIHGTIIEVHHIIPLSEIREDYVVDPIHDLIPVCSNCHTALHSKKDGVYTPEELKILYEALL